MRKRMNVYLTTGRKNLFYCYPAIHSLFLENQDSEIYLYLVSEDLEDADIEKERELAARYGHRIVLLHFDIERAGQSIVSKNPDHWPIGTLGCYWLFHELLPADVDRILAIEADTVTVGSLAEFYATDLDGYYAACPGPEHKPKSHRNLMQWLGGDTLTFVMSLYHVEAIRRDFSLADILETDAKVVREFGHSQQELTFGILFRGKIRFWPGVDSCVEENRQSMGELGYDYIRKCEASCKILHFSSFVEKEKPWNPVCVMPGYAIWWRYAQESPYYKKYIEGQWMIFDTKSTQLSIIKKNITYRNILLGTLIMIFFLQNGIGIFFPALKGQIVLFISVSYVLAFIVTLMIRQGLIWVENMKGKKRKGILQATKNWRHHK